MRRLVAVIPLLLALPTTIALAQVDGAATAPAVQATPAMPATPGPTAADPAQPVATSADLATYRTCMARLRGIATGKGVEGATFDRLTAGLAPDMGVLPLLDQQPEFTTPIWDYLAALVDGQRVDDGRAMLEAHVDTLARAQAEYGVDPATVVAVWGVESDYGRSFGKRPLLVSLSTLSCFGRRQPFFQGEFVATLQLLASGDLADAGITGSWAGAFGHTQFMPSTYQRVAVDFDGDGRRDLVGSIPDALGSTANYLKRSGWRTGEPWGYEIRLPQGFKAAQAGRTKRKPLSEWVAQGVRNVDGSAIDGVPADARAAVILPAGADGPAFLVFKNFDAIYSYNAAESYALAIAHLADRLRGGGAFATPWPTDDPGIDRAERRELQTLLLARGHAIGEADGMVGTLTRRAIVEEQKRLGMTPVDGRAGRRILEALRPAAPPAPPAAAASAAKATNTDRPAPESAEAHPAGHAGHAHRGGCESFTWDVSRELAALHAPAAAVTDGRKAGADAVRIEREVRHDVRLAPQQSVNLLAEPRKPASTADATAGQVVFQVPVEGRYRVAITTRHWIDVIDGGSTVPTLDFQGRPGCARMNKIVEFQLPAGRDLVLQFAGGQGETSGVVITRVEGAD